jgi:hypothetical protein
MRRVNQNLLVDVATRKPLAMKIRSRRKVIRLSPGEGRGVPAAPERSVGGR